VLVVSNNWAGTADLIDTHTLKRIKRINVIPDKAKRVAQIEANPDWKAIYDFNRAVPGEGHNQYVDDGFTSKDGRFVYFSRPSFADVVAIELATGRIAWRVKVDGYRADHMAISPDGTKLLVSASTARTIDVIDPRAGRIIARIPSGDQPHENNFSADGSRIFHASIGSVFTPLDEPQFDATKGERVFQVVDASTFQVLKRIDMGQKLDEAGHPDMSAAVRPMALAPGEQTVYFQVSFFHGFVEYDLVQDRVLRLAHLPLSQAAAGKRRDEYLLDSAHHGLTMNPEGTKLCAAGTMSDYAAIVDRASFAYRIVPVGLKPYWSTNSGDGRYCFVSVSGEDRVSVISYATEQEVARIPVGDHPQRMRMGELDVAARKPKLIVRVRPKRVRAHTPVTLRIRVMVRRAGRKLPVRGARVRAAGKRTRTNRKGRANVRKRDGFQEVRRYEVRARKGGYRRDVAKVRVTRRRGG
jgi:YVTN family beta-propeller protein